MLLSQIFLPTFNFKTNILIRIKILILNKYILLCRFFLNIGLKMLLSQLFFLKNETLYSIQPSTFESRHK